MASFIGLFVVIKAGLIRLAQSSSGLTNSFSAQGSRLPREFASIKSRLGHAEAGAGVMGIVHVLQRLGQHQTSAVLHLRSVNPHVASTLDSHSGKCTALLPRQEGPGPCSIFAEGEGHLGLSSFAFQV